MSRNSRMQQRLARSTSRSLRNWSEPPTTGPEPKAEAVVDCGWGRLIFGHTFRDASSVTKALSAEAEDRRDIVMYLRDPHVVTAQAPQEVFLDPSHTYRLWLRQYRPARSRPKGFICRRVNSREDVGAMVALGRTSSGVTGGRGSWCTWWLSTNRPGKSSAP